MNSIQANLNINSAPTSQKPASTAFEQHVDKVTYLLGFLDPSSRAPGLIGMISWESLKEGLYAEQGFFNEQLNSGTLSLKETDAAHDVLAKIGVAFEKMS